MISHNEMEVEQIGLAMPTSFHKALLNTVSDGSNHDIISFLSRPSIVRTGTWINTQTANSEIDFVNLPLDVMLSSKVYTQKLSGFLGFRAKAVLRLQVNTNRFQQGRLLMTYFPAVATAQVKHNSVQNSLRMRTQLPRVDFNAATDTEVIFEVPYVSTSLCYNMGDGSGESGHVGLIVYDPLNSASSELSAEYTIWAHFEDIELMFPSIPQNSIVPQSGNSRGRRFRVGDRNSTEIEASEPGFLTKALSKVSKASTILSEIPILSSVAGPVGWAAGIGARAATALGFSNPLISQQVTQVAIRPWIRGPNVNGADASYNLGYTEDAQVELLPGFSGQDIDEMALAYPLGLWSWHSTISWPDTALTYASLVTIPLGPTSFREQGPVTGTTYTNSPVSYFANLFQLYRGSFKIKLKFVKTEFHSGRLLITFNPRAPGVSTPAINNANASYVHREVVDIRDLTEFEFVAPFAATKPYLDCNLAYGDLGIIVLNELRHPDTVLSSVNIIIEVACCSDFEFAVPQNPWVFPYLLGNSATAQSGDARGRKIRVRAQGGETSEQQTIQTATITQEPDAIGTSNIMMDALASARFCIGEKIISLRQLVKRATLFGRTTSTGANFGLSVYPYVSKIPVYNTTTPGWVVKLPTGGIVYPDMVDWVSACYGFFRGSMRLKFQVNDTARNTCGRLALHSCTFTSVGQDAFVYKNGGAVNTNFLHAGIPYDTTQMPYPEVNIPYYNNTFMSNVVTDCGTASGGSAAINANVSSRPTSQVVSDLHPSDATSFWIYRQAGDDFSAGFWTGAPFTASNAMLPAKPAGP